MLKKLTALLLTILVLCPTRVFAQGQPGLSKLEVDLWPEYDRPEMLVINHLTLDSSVPLPANISLRIPAAVGDPAALAVRNPDGKLYNIPFDRTVNGEWSTLSFGTSSREIQLEYYDPGLVKNGSNRSFTYTWPGDYPVKSLLAQVQQPSGASNMQVSPSLGNGIPGDGGLLYYSSDLGSHPAQQPVTIRLNYQKPDDSLSVQSSKVGPSTPVDSTTPGRSNIALPWIFVIGAAALAMIGGGGWLFWKSPRGFSKNDRRRHVPYREKPTQPTPSEMVYCHQCGKKASAGDIYCRSCGARLRRD